MGYGLKRRYVGLCVGLCASLLPMRQFVMPKPVREDYRFGLDAYGFEVHRSSRFGPAAITLSDTTGLR
jgi:hypothetical protein